MGYRTAETALARRREELRERLERIDRERAIGEGRLSSSLDVRLEGLRRQAEPLDETAQGLFAAERAADEYDQTLDEALGLSAEMKKTVDPLLPRRDEMARWSGFALVAMLSIGGAVDALGLTSFMWRALGGDVARARPALTAFFAPRSSLTNPNPEARDLALTLDDPAPAHPGLSRESLDVSLTAAAADATDPH
ncbi:MAG: hypothetical protein AAF928_04475 [Myxococcota bacterium]